MEIDGDDNSKRSDELTVHIAAESGLIVVVAPGGIAHRYGKHDWWTDEDALLAETNAGHVVPIDTGSSGGYAIRIGFEELSDRERRLAAQTITFWLRVPEDEEVSVVTGEELSFPDTPGAASFWTSPGTYSATVTRLRWTEESDDESEDALPDYVVMLHPFRPGEEPPTFDGIPDMSAS